MLFVMLLGYNIYLSKISIILQITFSSTLNKSLVLMLGLDVIIM